MEILKKSLFITVLMPFLFSCTGDKQLSSYIEKSIATEKKLDLNAYQSFGWDAVLILKPYTVIDSVAKWNKLDLSNVDSAIDRRDDVNLLVCLRGNKAIKSIGIDRKWGDFKDCNRVIPKEKAIFTIKNKIFERVARKQPNQKGKRPFRFSGA